MTDYPADIGGGPEHFVRLHAVDVPQRPVERDRMPAIVADDALGDAGRARGIEDVERIGREHRHAVRLSRCRGKLPPVVVVSGHQLGMAHRPLQADRITRGFASLMRVANSCAANPPKTTEWIAPMRAQASIAKAASGTIGM